MNAGVGAGQEPVDGVHHPEAGPEDRHHDRPRLHPSDGRRAERRPDLDSTKSSCGTPRRRASRRARPSPGGRRPGRWSRRGGGPAARRRGGGRRRSQARAGIIAAVDRATLASYIDHTLLRPEATPADIVALCSEANALGVKAVCVSPPRLPLPPGLLDPTSPSPPCAGSRPAPTPPREGGRGGRPGGRGCHRGRHGDRPRPGARRRLGRSSTTSPRSAGLSTAPPC